MAQNIQTQTLKKQNSFMDFLKKEIVLVIAIVLAITSSFISIPKLSYIDFKVLILLFNLMIVVAAFKELKVLDSIAIGLLKKCNTYTSISFALVFITFIASMIVTNDVALITFVPLSIVIARKANIDVLKIVIFQTLAANLGSSFTPMGNPQNLFIYSYYDLSPIDFLKITLPIVILAIAFLSILIIKDKKMKLKLDLSDVIMENKKDVILFSLLFVIILLSVFHLIYSYYDLSLIELLKITLPIVILAIIFLAILIVKDKKMKLKLDLSDVIMENKKDVILFSLLFVIILLSVFHLIDYKITFIITIVTVLILNRRLFKEVDYSLLLTFTGFFIFIGNISTMDVVRNFMENILNSEKSTFISSILASQIISLLLTFTGFFIFIGNISTMDVVRNFMENILNSEKSTFISSILASQIISNVPATMLLSGFTNHFKELLLGVNIGGTGTLIASLASVISYKIYTSEFKDNNDRYLSKFTLYNVLGLGVFVPMIYLLLF